MTIHATHDKHKMMRKIYEFIICMYSNLYKFLILIQNSVLCLLKSLGVLSCILGRRTMFLYITVVYIRKILSVFVFNRSLSQIEQSTCGVASLAFSIYNDSNYFCCYVRNRSKLHFKITVNCVLTGSWQMNFSDIALCQLQI